MNLDNWKTTACGVGVILVWLIKVIFGVDCPSEVAQAISAVLIGLGFFFAHDAKGGGA